MYTYFIQNKENEAYEITVLPACPSVCPLHFTFYHLVDFHEIQLGDNATDVDLVAINFNTLPSRIPKLLTFELLAWMQKFHQSAWDYEVLRF
jgi:hypothetical protein